MKKIKSAYEIAMEKVDKLSEEKTPEVRRMEIRDELKPLLARFYREEISAEDLWNELQEVQDPLVLKEAQLCILESIGLRNAAGEIAYRKEGIMALENLKNGGATSEIETLMNRITTLLKEYERGREKIAQRFQEEMRNNPQMQMRPVQTEDGKTVMQVDPGIDEKTRQQLTSYMEEHERKCTMRFNSYVEELKRVLSIT